MTSIRKTKKLVKKKPTMVNPKWKFLTDFITPIKVGKYICGSPITALIWLEHIRRESAFLRRCMRNPRMRKAYCNPLRYGKHKKDKESVEA